MGNGSLTQRTAEKLDALQERALDVLLRVNQDAEAGPRRLAETAHALEALTLEIHQAVADLQVAVYAARHLVLKPAARRDAAWEAEMERHLGPLPAGARWDAYVAALSNTMAALQELEETCRDQHAMLVERVLRVLVA